jgi:ParB family chromosome partitioning protein
VTELTPLAASSAPLLRAIAALTPDGDHSNKALAEASGKDAKNLPRDLGVLVEAGWVTREPGSRPDITDAGREILAALDRFEGKADMGAPGAEAPLDMIDEDPLVQPRTHFDEDELESLAASIRDKGVIQPVRLRQSANPGDGRFRIVAGERRVRAARLAGLSTIPCVYRELTDDQALEIAMIENIQRVDMNAIEEAKGFKAIIEAKLRNDPALELKDAKEVIAEATRKTVRYVEQRIDLLILPAGTQLKIIGGEMGLRDARNAVQAIRDIERRAKERTLKPAELLVVAELVDKLEKQPADIRPTQYYSPEIWTEIDYMVDGFYIAETYIAEKPTKGLAWALAKRNIIEIKGLEDGRTVAKLGWLFSRDDLKSQLPGFGGKTTREGALVGLRDKVLGEEPWPGRDKNRYTTEWLNGPLKPEPDRARAWAEAQVEKDAQEAERQAARDLQEQQQSETRDRNERDNGSEGRSFLESVRELEVAAAAGLSAEGIRAAVAAMMQQRQFSAPFKTAFDDHHVFRTDADGKTWAASGPANEALYRLAGLALNLMLGVTPSLADMDLDTPWSKPPAVVDVNDDDTQAESAEQFERWIGERLVAMHSAEEGDATGLAGLALKRMLDDDDLEFGDPESDWSRASADYIADGWFDDHGLKAPALADTPAEAALEPEDA